MFTVGETDIRFDEDVHERACNEKCSEENVDSSPRNKGEGGVNQR
jgi:hypothetical protein